MPRENYDYLSDETRDALTDNVKAMAAGWGKSVEYIYAILRSEKGDFFTAFESMYRGACEGGVSTAHWDRKLAFHRETAEAKRRKRPATELLSEKIASDASTTQRMLDALRDGRIDERERIEILKDVDREQANLNEIVRLLSREERVN